jgi:hypothetical protein
VKLVIKLLDRWRVLPWLQGGTDSAHSFHEAIGSVLRNEVSHIRKHSRALVNITSWHVGRTKIQFGHRAIDVYVRKNGRSEESRVGKE